ncbi:hypothetical protein [Aquabacterium sp.]|uniref:hypothetical protein n=1 Tax=Aquabacterium sp. TaxID=1872578 RepID=UPI003784ECA9
MTIGTAGNDSWTIINPGSYLIDGLGGTDTVSLGTSTRAAYTLTQGGDGAVEIDAISGASASLHITLYNVERLVLDSGRDVIDLSTFFGPAMIVGGAGNDSFSAPAASQNYDGSGGIDTVVFAQPRAAYALALSTGADVVSTGSLRYELANVERLRFNDVQLALDLDGHAGQVAKLLGAVFGAEAVANPAYVGIGLQLADGGTSYEALGQLALDAQLGPNASAQAVVTLLYTNVVGVAPGPADLAFYVGLLEAQTFTPGALAVLAADTDLNQAHIDLVGLAHTGLAFA